jgi:hypothetical protein
MPLLNFFGRAGLLKNLDATVRVNLSTNTSLGLKYQFLGNKKSQFAASLICEAGLSFPFFFGNFFTNYSIGSIISYYPNEKLNITLAPRFLHAENANSYYKSRISSGELVSDVLYNIDRHFIINYAISYGGKYNFGLDITHFIQNEAFYSRNVDNPQFYLSLFFSIELGNKLLP